MNTIFAIGDTPECAEIISRQLTGLFETVHIPSNEIARAEAPGTFSVVSTDLKNAAVIADLRQWLKRRPKGATVVFITEKDSRLEAAQAHALGATDIIHHPSEIGSVFAKDPTDLNSLAEGLLLSDGEAAAGIEASIQALQSVFASAVAGGPLDQTAIDSAGDAIIEQIHDDGLDSWVETVRRHHSQTYQHSLLVTGVAVGFGRLIGLGHRDLKRLSFGSILHDIGKAKIPVAILEKPSALDEKEREIIKQHPTFGSEALASTPGLAPEMIDVVVHHHEFLDGSGYPHGLSGSKISDLVRIMTIADIFGALIERRSYKAPMPKEAAYQILKDMGPKLDKDLVREFQHIAELKAA